MTWQRHLAPPILGAGIAATTTSIVNAATHPYAEKANEAYREGAQTGLVLRYTVLGGLFAFLVDFLMRDARRHGSLRAAIAARGGAVIALLSLIVVVGVAVVPLFVGGYDASDRLRDQRAGFVDGCANNQPRDYCVCLWDELRKNPSTDSSEEMRALAAEVRTTGRPPPALRRAVEHCSP